MSIMKIYLLLRVLVQSALWLILWTILIAQPIGRLVSSTFQYAIIELSDLQCITVQSILILYAILYFGMLLILQYNFLKGTPAEQPFFSALKIRQLYTKSGYIPFRTRSNIPERGARYRQIAFLLGLNAFWRAAWTFISAGLYFLGAVHFMGSCDEIDMECSCKNLPYLAPAFLVAAIFGCALLSMRYVSSVNAMKNDMDMT